jgi:hypothetical protein
MPHEMAGATMTGINLFNMLGPAVYLQGLGVMMQALYPEASRGPAAFDASFMVCTITLLAAAAIYTFTKENKLRTN